MSSCGQWGAIFSRLIMDSPISFDDNPWIHKAQLSRQPRQQQLSRCTDNKPGLLSVCLHFFLPWEWHLKKKKKEKKYKCRASIILLCIVGMSLGCSCCTWHRLWSRLRHTRKFRKSSPGVAPISSEPGSKNEIFFAPVPKPQLELHNAACLVSVTPPPDKVEQRNRHAEGNFKLSSYLCCFFPSDNLASFKQTFKPWTPHWTVFQFDLFIWSRMLTSPLSKIPSNKHGRNPTVWVSVFFHLEAQEETRDIFSSQLSYLFWSVAKSSSAGFRLTELTHNLHQVMFVSNYQLSSWAESSLNRCWRTKLVRLGASSSHWPVIPKNRQATYLRKCDMKLCLSSVSIVTAQNNK